jgi:hypothetical protein
VNNLRKQLDEKDWITEQNIRNMQKIKEELTDQLKISRSSEVNLKKRLENLQTEHNEKEKILKGYDEKFKLAEDSLKLFYSTVKYKEEQINSEKL